MVNWDNLEEGFDPGLPHQAFYVVRGKPGTGKTTLVCGCPDSLHLDCDPMSGGKYVVRGRAKRRPVTSWAEWCRERDRLIEDAKVNKDKRRFKAIIIDPAGHFYGYCMESVKQKLGVEEITGFEYGDVAREMRREWLKLLNAGYGVFLTDHIVSRFALVKGSSGEQQIDEALLPNSVVKLLEQDCHHVITTVLEPARVDEVDPKTGKSIARTKLKYVWTTKPGRKTSLANPKSRVWLPEVFTNVPQVGTAADLWDHFADEWSKAVKVMQEANKKAE